jgi:hypothetical protein
MDPVTALGIASSVVQFVDFGSRLLSKTAQVHKAGTTYDHINPEAITEDLRRVTEGLAIDLHKSSTQGELTSPEQNVQQLCQECSQISSQLLSALASLKQPRSRRFQSTARHPRWESFRQAVQTIWSENEVESIKNDWTGSGNG